MDIYTGRVLVLVGKSIYIDILLGNNLFSVLFDNEKKGTLETFLKNWKLLQCPYPLKAHWQISKKWCFEKYFSCDQACQFFVL